MHHKAVEFDIGVYFEANGHGTAVFKASFVKRLELMASMDRAAQAAVKAAEAKAAESRSVKSSHVMSRRDKECTCFCYFTFMFVLIVVLFTVLDKTITN